MTQRKPKHSPDPHQQGSPYDAWLDTLDDLSSLDNEADLERLMDDAHANLDRIDVD